MTVPGRLVIEPLDQRHNRTTFSCGVPELDHYFMYQAGQDIRRHIARVFVCTADDTNTVFGFYTLSALSIDLASLPEEFFRRLPRHPVPCVLLGRLAIDASAHRQGLGRMLLADAIKRTTVAAKTVAMYAMIVDATNENAKHFYEVFGFSPLRDDPMRLFLPFGRTLR